MTVRVIHGDALAVLPTLSGIDACVCDPPYHLTSIVKRFGAANAAPAQFGSDGAFARASRGFMGKQWDGGDVALRPETWRLVLDALKPGAHLIAFGGTRTFHRMACAIEDAGFEIRDTLMWVYGSGFPKSHDVSKGIDKARKDNPDWQRVGEFLRLGRTAHGTTAKDLCARIGAHGAVNHGGAVSNWENGFACPTWEQWQAIRSFLPLSNDMDDEVWRLNGRKGKPGDAWYDREVIGQTDGSRLAVAPGQDNDRSAITLDITAPATPEAAQWAGWGTALKPAFEPIILARKPLIGTVVANVLAHGTGALNIDACRVAAADKTPAPVGHYGGSSIGPNGHSGLRDGSADHLGRWPANLCHDGSDEVEAAFAAFGDKPTGLGGITKRNTNSPVYSGPASSQDRVTTGFGDSGSASRFFYCAKADADDRAWSRHPTVKPLALMKWLVRLVTPPGGTVLDCFAGSGTTGEAAEREGFNAVLIEREAEYIADIHRRLGRASGADTPLFAEPAA